MVAIKNDENVEGVSYTFDYISYAPRPDDVLPEFVNFTYMKIPRFLK